MSSVSRSAHALPPLARLLSEIADAAAVAIRAVQADGLEVFTKADGSVATSADLAAEAVILDGLRAHFADTPVISEERHAAPIHPGAARFFLVDPIDGTRGFAKGRDSYTVNIGLIVDGVPVAGVVTAPALQQAFVAADDQAFQRDAAGQWRVIHGQCPAAGPGRIGVMSYSQDDVARQILQAAGVGEIRPVSSSIKFGLLANGQAHVYARGHHLMAWDTAAGDAVLRAAGGQMLRRDGSVLRYESTDLVLPNFVAWSACASSTS